MFPSLTIYTVNADITLLTAILNSVAMICNSQTAMIWGFAMMVSTWTLVKTITSASLAAAGGNGGSTLSGGVMSIIMPLILAMLLTNSGLKTRVQIESTIQGTQSAVDHVPFILAVVPASASLLSQELGQVVETAFQGTGTEYGSISASYNGFINPLKVLLTSRSAVMKLGQVDTQVRAIVSSCLGYDSGVNYSDVINKVVNAGNTGATEAETLQIMGVGKTAIGALLYQASQNEFGLVPDIMGSDPNQLLSCSDAATKVAANIETALSSKEFERAVLGSLNGMDNLQTGANYSFDTISGQYDAIRQAKDGIQAITQGASQTRTETLNLFFSELLDVELSCIKADSTNKSMCQAIAQQKMETERANLQNAAAVTPMLQYAGNFANYITALVIGLGPVIVMFMMFAGANLSKNINAAVHVMVWPLLVMNVGAEIVNGMIYISVASFLRAIAQGGFITQLQAIEAYKHLSIEVGVASQIMASLPVLMSMIFVLGESAASVSVAKSMEPGSKDIGDQAQTKLTSSTPIVSQGSTAQSQFNPQGGKWQFTGAMDMASTSATFGSMGNEASESVTNAFVKQQTISEGEQNLADWKKAFRTGDYSRVGVDKRTGDSIRDNFEKTMRESDLARKSSSTRESKTDQNSTTNSIEASLGTGGIGFGGKTSSSATAIDSISSDNTKEAAHSAEESKALVSAVSKEKSKSETESKGKETNSSLERTAATQRSYQKVLSETQSSTDAYAQAVKNSDGFVGYSAKIGVNEIATQAQTNADYQRFQLVQGRNLDKMPAAQAALESTRRMMDSASTDNIFGDERSKEAAIRHAAAVKIAQDEGASSKDRATAIKYLADEAKAMTGLQLKNMSQPEMRKVDIGSPKDNTNVDPARLGAPPLTPYVQPSANKKIVATPKTPSPTSSVPDAKPEPKIDQSFLQKTKEEVNASQREAGTVFRADKLTVRNILDKDME